MASGTAPRVPSPAPSDRPPDPYEVLIDARLRQTRRQVKTVDVTVGLISLVAAVLGYLLLAALVDHWLVPGGLGLAGRVVMFFGLVLVAGAIFVWRVLPAIVFRINPVFAASVLEQTRPSLKNSLINFLFLRHASTQEADDELSRSIYRGLERRTAAEVSEIPPETAVDRSHVVHLGMVLAGIFALSSLYLVLSPKNPLASYGRVIWPWAPIHVPTRVTIDDVRPGNAVEYQGQSIVVSAQVHGTRKNEPVFLYYTTSDGRSVNQAVPMSVPEKGYRYQAPLPPGKAGLQQDLRYWLAAGDFRTPDFHVRVETPLTILIDSVTYDFPAYTGLPSQTTRAGDVRAVEGTRVTIRATASQTIDWAAVEFDGDSRNRLTMTAEGDKATATFTLAMKGDDRSEPQYKSYQLRFAEAKSGERRQNHEPIRYQIEVIPDFPPRVEVVEPKADRVGVRLSGSLDVRVRAEDPDFALRRVRLNWQGHNLPIVLLLEKHPTESPHRGPFEANYQFKPAALGLKPGDKVLCWAEARDSKEPGPNDAKSRPFEITVVSDQSRPPEGRQGQPGDQGNAGNRPGTPDQQQGQPPRNQNAQPPQADQQNPPRGQEQDGARKPEQPKNQGQPNQQAGQEPPGRQGDQPQQSGDRGQQGQVQPQNAQNGPQPSGQNQGQEEQQPKQSGEKQPGDANPGGPGGQAGQAGNQQGQQTGNQQGQPSGAQQGQQSNNAQGQPSSAGPNGQQPQGADPQRSVAENDRRDKPIDGETNPGDVFDKVLKYRREENQQKQGQGGQDNASGQKQEPSAGQPKPGDQQGGQPNNVPKQGAENGSKQDEPQGQQGGAQEGARPSTGASGQNPQEKSGANSGNPQNAKPAGAQGKPDAGQPAQNDSQPSSGQSDSAKPDAKQPGAKTPDEKTQPGQPRTADPNAAEKQPGAGQQARDQAAQKPSGQEPNDQGAAPQSGGKESGAGNPKQNQQSPPSPQGANQERKPSSDPTGKPQQGQQSDPTSTSISPHKSDSKAPEDEGGNLSGGGGQGGGQNAQQPGSGNPGSQKPSDAGAGASSEKGPGQTGTKAGDQQQSDRATGQAGPKGQGAGAGKPEQNPSQKPAEGQASQQSKPQQNGGQSAAPQGQSAGNQPDGKQPGGNPSTPGQAGKGDAGGNQPGGATGAGAQGNPPPPSNAQSAPDGSDPNLEYASKTTNLALEYLQDQLAKQKPDQKLLDGLGWNRDQLAEFVRQWEKMKADARQEGPKGDEAKKNLNQALRSLGLRPSGTQLQGSPGRRDQVGRLESRRSDPPPEWESLFKAYSEGVGSGRE